MSRQFPRLQIASLQPITTDNPNPSWGVVNSMSEDNAECRAMRTGGVDELTQRARQRLHRYNNAAQDQHGYFRGWRFRIIDADTGEVIHV